MKIVVFGATGGTGRLFVAGALGAGHAVTVLARTPAKLGDLAANVRLIPGDATDRAAVEAACAGQEVAVTALGGRHPLPRTPSLTIAMHNILMAIEGSGIGRLIYLSADTVDRHRHPFFRRRILVPLVLAGSAADHELDEAMIRRSRVPFVIVRPPMLTDGPATGRYQAGEDIRSSAPIARVSRADVAAFMLDQLTDDRFLRRAASLLPSAAPFVASPRRVA